METLYCRARDGGYRVDVLEGRYLLHAPGGPFEYNNQRALIAKITGHPRGRNWTLYRYFRQGTTTTDDGAWGVLPQVGRKSAPGIDLREKHLDVRRLFFHGFMPRLRHSRTSVVDPEDALQDLYLAILSRNRGRGKFDPTRSSFSHYVHLVSRTTLHQSGRKQARWNREVLSDGEKDQQEEGISAPSVTDESTIEGIVSHLRDGGGEVARAADLLALGHTEREIALEMRKPLSETKKIVGQVRERLRQWLADND